MINDGNPEHTLDQPTRSAEPTRWHRLLGKLLELVLTTVEVIVQTELPVMNDPPAVDIVLLRRTRKAWTAAQRALLPDGVRDSRASHVLLEFKYTESLTLDALVQAIGYAFWYRRRQRLKPSETQVFVLCAKTPRPERLALWSYSKTDTPGIYRSTNIFVQHVPLLVLNQLRNEPHNAFVKCFASRDEAKRAAFQLLNQGNFSQLPLLLWIFLIGLRQLLLAQEGEEEMSQEITPDRVMEVGEQWHKRILDHMTVEERLAGLSPEEVLAQYTPEEVLAQYTPEEVLAQYTPEEVLAQYTPEEVLAQYTPEEVLARLPLEEIEAYLRKLKGRHSGVTNSGNTRTDPARNN